jgi:hypothetical protein
LFRQALGHKQPIKGIAMMVGQCRHLHQMFWLDRQNLRENRRTTCVSNVSSGISSVRRPFPVLMAISPHW